MLGDAGGTFEQTVTLPAAPDSRHDLLAQKDGITAPQPNFLRVVDFPNVLEAAEPNNDITTATVATGSLPLAFNGILQTKEDVDFFKFSAKKGQMFDFTSHSREMRSPIDTVINIQNSKGANVGGNDDQGGPDSYLRWTAPEDGDFFLTVRDHLKRGGPLFIYRIEAQAVQQKLLSYIPETVQNSSQERRAVPVPFPPFYFSWSPTGEQLAYLSNWMRPGALSMALRVVEVGEPSGTARTVAEGQPFYFSWAPDGQRLLAQYRVGR